MVGDAGSAPGSPVALLVSNRAYGIASSRLGLGERLVASGWRVVVAGADDPSRESLDAAGAEFRPLSFRRGGVNPWADLRTLGTLIALCRELKPDLIHHFNTKPILIGGLAARSVGGAVVVNTVTGLGYGLARPGHVATMLERWYRLVLHTAHCTIFQNPDDRDYFLQRGLVTDPRTRLIRSSGVDVRKFAPPDVPPEDGEVRILLASRLVRQKGIRQYLDVASSVRKRSSRIRFLLAGEVDPGHPDAIPTSWIDGAVEEGHIEFLGYVSDMPRLLRGVHVVAVPSLLREGSPRVVLEAAATGVPVVASDLPGCRDAVRDGETGLLVPAGDVVALQEGLVRLAEDAGLRRAFGRRGRKLIEERYDRRKILAEMLEVYADAGLDVQPMSAS